jgi:light-harvesting protein B-800-850 alpha chain
MIYGKIWCVVKPSVGIPLFLGAVAVSSFAVHYMLTTQTTWVKRFLNGSGAAAATAAAPTDTAAPPSVVAAAAPKSP